MSEPVIRACRVSGLVFDLREEDHGGGGDCCGRGVSRWGGVCGGVEIPWRYGVAGGGEVVDVELRDAPGGVEEVLSTGSVVH